MGRMGPFPPSGKRVNFDFGAVARLENSKLAELWITWDNMTILGQLGLMGRLGANVRDKQGLAYFAASMIEVGAGPAPWSARAGVNRANVEQAIASILAEMRLRLQGLGLTGEFWRLA